MRNVFRGIVAMAVAMSTAFVFASASEGGGQGNEGVKKAVGDHSGSPDCSTVEVAQGTETVNTSGVAE